LFSFWKATNFNAVLRQQSSIVKPAMPRKKSSRVESLRALRLVALCAAVTLAVLALEFLAPAWLRSPVADADNYFQDLFSRLGRYTPANTNLVLIGIDRPSYADLFITDEEKKIPCSPPCVNVFRGRAKFGPRPSRGLRMPARKSSPSTS
jgi:hypothetical protein